MKLTKYHTKYFAHELTKECASNDLQKFTRTLLNARVDLNPHQIEAALFAFKSPFSKGAILADEVGLGKTIEAGILLSQKWAEGKRKILLIMPSSLRKQWQQELQDKFYLPSLILEAGSFNASKKDGKSNPFESDQIVICSYNFAKSKSDFVQQVPWDLVVIDEAHRLRNVYKKDNKIANELKLVLKDAPKVLLTATPLQNSLLELYGLTSLIDEQVFGNIESFRSQFTRADDERFDDLKARLKPICQRTLRKQVPEIPYTNRIAITQEFFPTEEEHKLYEEVSAYLQGAELYALPKSQRHLMTLILRKLLASSSFAISGTLLKLALKLEDFLATGKVVDATESDILPDDEESMLGEHLDEYSDDDVVDERHTYSQADKQAIEKEIKLLRHYHELAVAIEHNAKGDALLEGLKKGFQALKENGAPDKAVIFTESTRTQNYLFDLLNNDPEYAGKVILFNGSNNSEQTKKIYREYCDKYAGTDHLSGSPTADTRAALVEAFRGEGKFLIATEAAAEGINLQFCSLIVNYDLPWNPQRIEQRIGRCHRYGQKFDVVVINFLNKKNAADQRVYQLLNEKFKLFNGVFGASDEVLGAIQSGVDFEKRIVEIYQQCRSEADIKSAFDSLQAELDEQLSHKMTNARQKLLENFDEEVREKLKVQSERTKRVLQAQEMYLWKIARHQLSDIATFSDEEFLLDLHEAPAEGIPVGRYHMDYHKEEPHHFRIGCSLAVWLLENAKEQETPDGGVVFNYSDTPTKISVLESLVGKSGSLCLKKIRIEGIENQDILVFAGVTSDGTQLEDEQCFRLFSVNGTIGEVSSTADVSMLKKRYEERKNQLMTDISEQNAHYFNEESEKLEKWAEDKKASLEKEMRDTKLHLRELNKQNRQESDMAKKLEIQKKVRDTERKLRTLRQNIFKAEDEIETQRDKLITELESRLKQSSSEEHLFTINWQII